MLNLCDALLPNASRVISSKILDVSLELIFLKHDQVKDLEYVC